MANKKVVVRAALAEDKGRELKVTSPKKVRVSRSKEIQKENTKENIIR